MNIRLLYLLPPKVSLLTEDLRSHAEAELKALGYKLDGSDEEMNGLMADNILELIDTFADQGHSGFSAGYCLGVFSKLADYKPIAPLTGEDDEWMKICDDPPNGPCYQNKRCSSVFKDKNGRTYDINGRVFRDKDGSTWSGKGSDVDITFPYTPKTEIVDRDPE